MKPPAQTQEAIFAMGCFWCGEAAFSDHETNEKFPGIVDVKVGFSGGDSTNPTYASHEGHKEVVRVTFDPSVKSYAELLDIFWHNIDPFDAKGQFCDKGSPYEGVIFVTPEQKESAEKSKAAVQAELKRPVVTQILDAKPFYEAGEEHQDYKIKNPVRYKVYRWNCGRDKRLKEVWGQK